MEKSVRILPLHTNEEYKIRGSSGKKDRNQDPCIPTLYQYISNILYNSN